MAAIFISHSSHDTEFAGQLKAWLNAEGYEYVFLDFDRETGVKVGEEWERRLYDEIARCHAVILVLTPHWLDSKWCFVEFTHARALGKTIFPVVLTPLGERLVAPEIQAVDLRDWSKEGQEYLRRRIREVTDEVARGFQWDSSRSPFPGIYSFDAEDAAIFFGRDAETREIIEKLEARRVSGGSPILFIVGQSGSGKSSILKAGVLPQLAREKTHWIILPTFRPEGAPLTSFAKCIALKLGQPEAWRSWLERFNAGDIGGVLDSAADELRVGASRGATLLISIDQFEESFTIADLAQQKLFLNLLHAAVDQKRMRRFQIICTLRSDLFAELLRTSFSTVPFSEYVLRLIPIERVTRLIEGPCSVAAVTIEHGLSQRIKEDVKVSDALPLLAFALREFYERFGRDRRLSIANYEKLGDPERSLTPIENAVRRKADDVINARRPSESELHSLKDAFIPHLVRVRDDGVFVRQQAALSDLPKAAQPLINAFVDARLLGTRVEGSEASKDGIVVEAAHEALFKAWPLLADWLSAERQFLVSKAQLDRFLLVWRSAEGSEKRNALLQGIYLSRAQDWLKTHRNALSPEEIQFIEASQRERQRRNRRLVGLVIAIACLILALVSPRVYAEYVYRTALGCDLYAAELDNDVHVPGVLLKQIIPEIAIPACTRAVRADPGNPRLLDNLGRTYESSGRYEEAAIWYGKAVEQSWPAAENNLGGLYFYGQGVPQDFARAVALIRAAADRGNHDAIQNYMHTPMTPLFVLNDVLASILEEALVKIGFVQRGDVKGSWNPKLVAAVEAYKAAEHLSDAEITLRVLDRLGVVDELSHAMKENQPVRSGEP